MTGTILLWVGFHIFVLAALVIDLGAFHRGGAHEISLRDAFLRTAIWVSLAFAFACGIYWFSGTERALMFVTGYIIEESLSVDNIFVFVMIFSYFALPRALQHRVLFWGILGAILMRGAMIIAGAALLHRFEWIAYLFGAFLLLTGLRMAIQSEDAMQPERNPVIRLMSRWFPITRGYQEGKFFVRQGRRLAVTPLFLVLVVVEATDVMFAVDSIPAIFAVTTDTFIVYTSNIFAILGLRSLYFVLAGAMDKFRYLRQSLAAVLIFVGAKMCTKDLIDVPVLVSLGVIVTILAIGVIASFVVARREAAVGGGESGTQEGRSHGA